MSRTQTRNGEIRKIVRSRAGGFCEACNRELADDASMHHRFQRHHGGKDAVPNLLHLCKECHVRIHRDHEWAYARGLLVSGIKPVEDEPFVLRNICWVYPERDGTYTYRDALPLLVPEAEAV